MSGLMKFEFVEESEVSVEVPVDLNRYDVNSNKSKFMICGRSFEVSRNTYSSGGFSSRGFGGRDSPPEGAIELMFDVKLLDKGYTAWEAKLQFDIAVRGKDSATDTIRKSCVENFSIKSLDRSVNLRMTIVIAKESRNKYVSDNVVQATLKTVHAFSSELDELNTSRLIVEGKPIAVNKHYLGMVSDFFYKLFFGAGFKEEALVDIPIQGATYDQMITLLRVLYPEHLEVDLAMAEWLLPLSDMWNIDLLRRRCDEGIRNEGRAAPSLGEGSFNISKVYVLTLRYSLPITQGWLARELEAKTSLVKLINASRECQQDMTDSEKYRLVSILVNATSERERDYSRYERRGEGRDRREGRVWDYGRIEQDRIPRNQYGRDDDEELDDDHDIREDDW